MLYPTAIALSRSTQQLELTFSDGLQGALDAEYLRVHSPSAEVQGHGPGQENLHTGKRSVRIEALEPVGRYALKIVFSDGHDSGLYTWAYLHGLVRDHDARWAQYLAKLDAAGASRDHAAPSLPRRACNKH